MAFRFERLEITDVILVHPRVFGDSRGFFAETYKESEFTAGGITFSFVQDNHSRSQKGVLRGLHYQLNPKAQGKLVRVIRGAIFDIAVDIRIGSPTFSRWAGAMLSEDNRAMLWIPPGFAHAFVSLDDNSEVLYKTTDEYAPELDRGIIWNDPTIAIAWPVTEPILSVKDASLPLLEAAEINFIFGETS